MTRLSPWSSPFLLGFDRLEQLLEEVADASSDGYPPYNIEQTGERSMRISLAVAGFRPGDLEITVDDHELTIEGRQDRGGGERSFLHRGIAARQFVRKFVLAEGMEVGDASLDDGLLNIELNRPEKKRRVRTIEIGSKEDRK